jgi:triosephosphate isomerase (TIM)
MRKSIVAGNWKLNGSRKRARALLDGLLQGPLPEGVRIVVFPPALYLAELVEAYSGTAIEFGAQDVSEHSQGAYTGELSAAMLLDVGARWTLVGHSERRAYHGESSELVARKARAAVNAGLSAIVCIGESRQERENLATEAVLRAQLAPVLSLEAEVLSGCVVAYEPVWAIGTGKASSGENANTMHQKVIRPALSELFGADNADRIRILYGGSVTASNASEFFAFPDIDGALVGGASLKPDEFVAITKAISGR